MKQISSKVEGEQIHVNGNGLFTKGKVTVSISKGKKDSGIVFVVNNEAIFANIQHVTNAVRNTVLTSGKESICLVEHFLAACSLLGVSDIKVTTNANELVFNDGSALHWHEALTNSYFTGKVKERYYLKEAVFVKNKDGEIIAIPHDGFQISYLMDWDHKSLGKLWASWKLGEDVNKLVRARTFAKKEENDFFDASDRLLTLEKECFNKPLYEPLEPVYHKILDLIGDLRLCGINPLEINMHVIAFKSGHTLNIELANELKKSFV